MWCLHISSHSVVPSYRLTAETLQAEKRCWMRYANEGDRHGLLMETQMTHEKLKRRHRAGKTTEKERLVGADGRRKKPKVKVRVHLILA